MLSECNRRKATNLCANVKTGISFFFLFFFKKGNNEPIRLALATSSALFKFLRGQRAKMRVPAC